MFYNHSVWFWLGVMVAVISYLKVGVPFAMRAVNEYCQSFVSDDIFRNSWWPGSWSDVRRKMKKLIFGVLSVGVFILAFGLWWAVYAFVYGDALREWLHDLTWDKFVRMIPVVRRRYLRMDREQAEKAQLRQKTREAQINQWKKDHPPVICYNEMNGVLAAMREDEYEKAKFNTHCAQINGEWGYKTLMPHPLTFIFRHASADKDAKVPPEFISGKKSDLIVAMSQKATLKVCSDIFVPFVSEGLVSFNDQARVIHRPSSYDYEWLDRAREHLLFVCVPAEVGN